MSDLKPCPFCGSDNIAEQDPGMGVHYMLCLHCHAQGPISFSPVVQWNKRIQPSDDPRKAVIGEIENEVVRATSLYPWWPDSLVEAVSIMAEEAGECIKSANDIAFFQKSSRAELRTELIQTAAMCIRAINGIDALEAKP